MSGPRLSRRQTWLFRFLLDELVPPVLRDRRWLMAPLFRLVYGPEYQEVMDFRARAPELDAAGLRSAYDRVGPLLLERETDLDEAGLAEIVLQACGDAVLEVGCGKGVLVARLMEDHRVTATELRVDDALRERLPGARLIEALAEELPFADASFDTVVCAHTLEHVLDLPRAVGELRRVARQRLLLVVPRQRPYRYSFDPHVHFFPYPHSLLQVLRPLPRLWQCQEIAGDLHYLEERDRP